MRDFLSGRTRADDFSAAFGPSPSGVARFSFYRTLIQRNVTHILNRLQPATRWYFESRKDNLWPAIIAGMEQQYPPSHYDPNRFGESLATYIEEHHPDHPAAAELADYEWLLYAASVSEHVPSPQDPGLERTLFVRQYDFAVVDFARDARRRLQHNDTPSPAKHSTDEQPHTPEARQTTLLVYRDPKTGLGRAFHPTSLGIMAIARLADPEASLPSSPAALDKALAELRAHGVLP